MFFRTTYHSPFSQALQVAGKNLDIVLTPSRIDNAFTKIGTKADALDLRKSIVPIARTNSSKYGTS